MDAESVRRIEHDARQHALLAALWTLGRGREYDLKTPGVIAPDVARTHAIAVIDTVGAAIRNDLLAMAKEASRDE